jgi:protein gp37
VSERTAIGWCDHTHNIGWGCTPISPGCANCYAAAFSARLGLKLWSPESNERRTFGDAYWRKPLGWNRKAKAAGVRRRVFCSSMADIGEDHPTIQAELARLWPLIESTDWLDWLLLTKRAERLPDILPANWGDGYDNVWLGVSVENERWTSRIDHLVRVPARVKFLSCEPLLGPINLRPWLWNHERPQLDWVIAGGESGPQHRPMDPAWLERISEDCGAVGTAFFAKQDSGRKPEQRGRISGDAWRHDFPRLAA